MCQNFSGYIRTPIQVWFFSYKTNIATKNGFIRDRLQILLLILREFEQISQILFPWNHQKTIHYLIISGKVELINT